MNRLTLFALIVLLAGSLAGCKVASTDNTGNLETPKKTDKSITGFRFTNPDAAGVINEAAHTISIAVPYGTSVNALIPVIAHTGVGLAPASGSAANFSSPVTYTVTAEDSSTQKYEVTVTISKPVVPRDALELELLFNQNSNDTSGMSVQMYEVVHTLEYAQDRFGTMNAAYFDGTNSVSIPRIRTTSNSFTCSFWANIGINQNQYAGLISSIAEEGMSNRTWSMSVRDNDTITLTLRDSAFSQTIELPRTAINKWYHTAIIYNGDAKRIDCWIDGQEILTSMTQVSLGPVIIYGNVGMCHDYANPTQKLKGMIDDVRIYSRCLTDNEIHLLHHEAN